MMVSCQYVIELQEIGFKKFGTELRRGWPTSDSSWKCYYMFGITTKFSMSFQVLKEIFFLGLGLMHLSIVCPTPPLLGNGGGWGEIFCLATKCGPSGGAFAATPIFYRQIKYMNIYLMVFCSLCEMAYN